MAIKKKLQHFHSVLIYPLRNAIMYNRVLNVGIDPDAVVRAAGTAFGTAHTDHDRDG